MGRSRCRRQFSGAAAKGMVDRHEDRSVPARALVEAFGGTTLCHSFAFGEHHGIAVVDFPDAGSAAALSLRAASTGGVTRFATTLPPTAKEAEAARQKPEVTAVDYPPPGA